MASLASYGMCQTACNAGAVACYAANGLVFGVSTGGAAIPAAIAVCNTVLGTCMSACALKFLAEGTTETGATGGAMGPVIAIGGVLITVGGMLFFKYKTRR